MILGADNGGSCIRMTSQNTSSYEIWADSSALHFDSMNGNRDFYFNSNQADENIVYITQGEGAVGIGVKPSALVGSRLAVSGDTSITGDLKIAGAGGAYGLDLNGAGSQTIRVKSTDNHVAVRIDRPSDSYDSNLMFQTNGTTKWRLAQGVVVAGDNYLSIYDDINNVGHTTFKAGGNVGIGTSEPSGRLHVRAGSMGPMGGATIDSRYNLVVEDNGENYIGMYAPTNSYNGIRFNDQLGLDGYIDYYHGTAGDCLVYSAGNHHKFQIGSAEEMRLTANSLIINTESHFNTDNHGAMLVVSGNASITSRILMTI